MGAARAVSIDPAALPSGANAGGDHHPRPKRRMLWPVVDLRNRVDRRTARSRARAPRSARVRARCRTTLWQNLGRLPDPPRPTDFACRVTDARTRALRTARWPALGPPFATRHVERRAALATLLRNRALRAPASRT